MGMQATDAPKLLYPELLSSSINEYNGTFSPDGQAFYYTTNTPEKGIITYTEMDAEGNWEKPKIAFFSGEFSEYDPIFSPDGQRLYFTSERPASLTDSSGKTNIWFIEKADSSWSEPQLLPLSRNGVYYSSFTRSGNLYLNVWDTGDMYKVEIGDTTHSLSALDTVLNSSNGEGDPFISPDEDYLIYRGYNNSLGRGDMYISFNIDGSWTAPENLGAPINSAAHEMCPYVTVDGKFFIFASARIRDSLDTQPGMDIAEVEAKYRSRDNGRTNIYYISADFIAERRKKYE